MTGLDVVTTERWAFWLVSCADEADDLTEGQRAGLRLAATHMRDPGIQQEAGRVWLPEHDGPHPPAPTTRQERPMTDTPTLTPAEQIVRDALGATDASTYHGQVQDLDARAREAVAKLRELFAEQVDAVLLTVDDVGWEQPGGRPRAFITEDNEGLRTSYDRQNLARHLAGLPMRPVVGGEVDDMFELAHAAAGTTISARDGERGIVTRTEHSGPGKPGHTSYGVTWASGRTGDRGNDSPWPARILDVPTGVVA